MANVSQMTTPAALTARQTQVLELIRQYIVDTGYPPTRADIAKELGFITVHLTDPDNIINEINKYI